MAYNATYHFYAGFHLNSLNIFHCVYCGSYLGKRQVAFAFFRQSKKKEKKTKVKQLSESVSLSHVRTNTKAVFMPVKIDNNYLNSKTGNGPMIHSGENDNWSISR